MQEIGKSTRTLVVSVSLAVLLGGCGGGNDLVPVKGVLTLDGTPVEGAALAFISEASEGNAAQAMTGSGGTFTLETTGQQGIKPGDYKVTVFKLDVASTNGMEKSVARPRSILPAVYSSKDKTPLKVSIPPEGKLEGGLKIELKSQP